MDDECRRSGLPPRCRRVWREGAAAPELERVVEGEAQLLALLQERFGIRL